MIAPPISFPIGTPGTPVDVSGIARQGRTWIWAPTTSADQIKLEAGSGDPASWATRRTFGSVGEAVVLEDNAPWYRATRLAGTGGKLFLIGEPAPPASPQVLGDARLAVDTSSAIATFTPLLQVNFSLSAPATVRLTGNLAVNKTGATGFVQARLRVNLSGPPFPINVVSNVAASSSALYRVALPAGAYTASLEWSCAGGSTRQCFPVATPDENRAYLLVEREV